MLKKSNAKNFLSSLGGMITVLTLVAIISAIVLGVAYQVTKEPIEKAKNARELAAIQEVLPGEFDNNPFEDRIIRTQPGNRNTIEIYPGRQGSDVKGIAVKSYSDKAFGGRLELIVGFFLDGTINGFKIIEQKETPGLGTKISEEKFSGQFKGFDPSRGVFKVRQDGGEIDAVTAATISSRAVIDAIDRAHKAYLKLNAGK